MKAPLLTVLAGAAAALLLAAGCDKSSDSEIASTKGGNGKIKIGYLVKQPEEPWFQTEWRFAQKAADENGFELVKLAVPDSEKTLAAIDNLGASGAKGFVICTPDVRLGPAIKRKADEWKLKVVAVDDRFLGDDGKPMTEVPILAMSAPDIGKRSGSAIAQEWKRRGWSASDTAAVIITFDELGTAQERTNGIREGLLAGGFPADKIFTTPQQAPDIPSAQETTSAFLVKHPGVKHWLVGGFNDNTVLGGVRAMEKAGFDADSCVGVGINGTDGIAEFQKSKPSPFFGSILMSPGTHGRETVLMVYKWVKEGIAPPPETKTTVATLETRATFEDALKKEGLQEMLKR